MAELIFMPTATAVDIVRDAQVICVDDQLYVRHPLKPGWTVAGIGWTGLMALEPFTDEEVIRLVDAAEVLGYIPDLLGSTVIRVRGYDG